MPEPVPALLLPYIRHVLHPFALTLVSSTLSTPANWLLVRLVYTTLHSAGEAGSSDLKNDAIPVSFKAGVILVSLFRPLDLWIELCKKVGLDLQSALKAKTVHYIDGLAFNQSAIPYQSNGHVTTLNGLSLDALSSAVKVATLPLNSGTDAMISRPTVIIDGIDVLLASQSITDVAKVQHFISQLRHSANALVLTSSADSPLLHNSHVSANALERDHAAFVTSMAHQSSWVMQLRALDTGSAKDVTGVLRISKGGAYEEVEDVKTQLEEVEWLYQVKGDGSARVWSRGD